MRSLRVFLGLALVRLAGRVGGFRDPGVPAAPSFDPDRPMGWWCISGEALLTALYEAHHGETPDAVYAELYANSEHEWPVR